MFVFSPNLCGWSFVLSSLLFSHSFLLPSSSSPLSLPDNDKDNDNDNNNVNTDAKAHAIATAYF